MSSTVTADNGTMLPLEDMPLTFVFSGSFLSTITGVYQGITYVQTYTNNGTNITHISAWIAQ